MTKERRRDKGDGSVHRRGKGWVAYLTLPNGNRKYFYGRTQDSVKERMKRYRNRLERGERVMEEKRTVAEYLEWWLDDARLSGRRAPETLRSYETKVRLHIVPAIGHVKLAQLTPMHVRQLLSDRVGEGLSSKQVNHIHDVLHTALEQARKLEVVDRNVASLVDPPRIVQKDRQALSLEQANKLMTVLDGHRMQPFFRTLLTLGLRPGEGLGLEWRSVDFDAETIRIQTTLQRHNGEWMLKEPKTPASKQTLPLPRALARHLQEHQYRLTHERTAAEPSWQDWGLVFPRPNGMPCWYSDAGRLLKDSCRKGGIPEVSMHELRHSTPSILLSMGVDQRVIMQILRHSTIVLTANLYTHVADPTVRAALNQIDRGLL